MKKSALALFCLTALSLFALEKPATVPEVTRWEAGSGTLAVPANLKSIVETKLDKSAKNLGSEGYTIVIGPKHNGYTYKDLKK